MNYYNLNIMLQSQADCKLIYNTYNSKITPDDDYLETILPIIFNAKQISKSKGITVESFRVFTNEIEISCYGSKFPSIEVARFVDSITFDQENAIKLETNYGSDGGKEFYYLVNGRKTTKSKYQSFYKKNKIKDPTVDFIKHLKNYNFKKAYSIIDLCDLTTIDPNDDNPPWQLVLLNEGEPSALVIKLIEAGVITEFMPNYNIPWLEEIFSTSSLDILELFFRMDYRLFSSDPNRTPVHCALQSETTDSIEKLKLILETFPKDKSKVTKYGSPLWLREERNIACGEYLESLGGEVIPPLHFYNDLSAKDKIIEAAKHNDIKNFKDFYEERYRNLVLFSAIQCQSYKIIQYLNQESLINWLEVINEDLIPSTEDPEEYEDMTFCELGLMPIEDDYFYYQSLHLFELIKSSLPNNIKTIKLEEAKYPKEVISNAKRNFTRYKRWRDKYLPH